MRYYFIFGLVERHKLQLNALIFKLVILILLSSKLLCGSIYAQNNTNQDTIDKYYSRAKINYKNGKYENAVLDLKLVLNYKNTVKEDYHPEYFKVHNRLGLVYKLYGKHQEAINNYEQALSFTNDSFYIPQILMNIANVYSLKGDYNTSINYLNVALKIILDGEIEYSKLADLYYVFGKTYDNSGQINLALNYFLNSARIRKNKGLKEDGDTYLNCGKLYDKSEIPDTARYYYNKAIKCYTREFGKNHYLTAFARMHFAVFLSKEGNYSQSQEWINSSLEIILQTLGNKHIYTSNCFKYLGNINSQNNNYVDAIYYYQKALISKVYEFNDSNITSNPTQIVFPDIDILEILKGKANAFERLSILENEEFNLKEALKVLEIKAKLIERLRIGYLNEDVKLRLAQNENDTYSAILRITTQLLKLTNNEQYARKAFKYGEYSKYAVLREFYNKDAAMKTASIPDSLIFKEKNIREQIGILRHKITYDISTITPDNNRITQQNEELFNLEHKLEVLTRKLENDYPKFQKSKYDSKVIEIDDLMRVLPKGDVILEYVIADSSLYTFLITKEHFSFQSDSLNLTFYQHLEFYNKFLHSNYGLNYDTFRISAYGLYEKLIKPYELKIQGKRLLIIPDEELALMAFETLVDVPLEEREWIDYSFEPYILRKYPIGYAYSASLFAQSMKSKPKFWKRILAISPSYEDSKDSLPPIPVAIKYLRRLTIGRGKLFYEDEATETNFKKVVENYDILHIYAHGYEDSCNASLSRIFFSDKYDSINDSYLFAHEINKLNINADLVVLASCYSGSGKISEGEGVLSLGRSFLNAGASSLVLSLWSASYEPTIKEMRRFHLYLLMGKRKDEALQLAKLNYLDNANSLTARPKNWASIVVIGNQEPLYHLTILKLSLLLGSMITILLIIIYKLRLKKIK